MTKKVKASTTGTLGSLAPATIEALKAQIAVLLNYGGGAGGTGGAPVTPLNALRDLAPDEVAHLKEQIAALLNYTTQGGVPKS